VQIPGDAAFTDAVGAPLRRPVARLRADWDRDGLFAHARSDLTPVLSEVTVERSLTGDLPDAVSLIEGYASAALTATLEGAWADAQTAAAVLSPYREDSPLYRRPTLGVPVEADFGFAGGALVRQFTGQIRSLRPDSRSRRVALTALDPADRLRALVSLPVYGIYRRDLVRYGRSGVPWSTNSTWVIDYILRRNGIYHAPPPRSDAILSVTNNGGLAAEVGFANDVVKNPWRGPYDGTSVWTTGPFGGLATPGWWDHPIPVPFQNYYCSDQIRLLPGVGFGMSTWTYVGTGANGDGTQSRILSELIPSSNAASGTLTDFYRLNGSNTGRFSVSVLSAGLATQTFFFGVAQSAKWRYVSVHVKVNSNSTVTLTCRADGSTTVFTANITSSHRSLVWYPLARAITYFRARLANHQVWLAPEAPTTYPDETFTSKAALTRGANELDYLPDVQLAESWGLLQDVAGAEYAVVGFDEAGVFFFRPRSVTTDPSTVEREITADRSLIDLAGEVNIDTVRNVIGIAARDGFFGDYVAVIDSKDPLEFESPVGVWTFAVTLPPLTTGPTDQAIPAVTAAQWQATTYTWGFVAVQAADTTIEVSAGVGVEYVHTGGRTGQVIVRNYSEFPVRFQLPSATGGQGALRVAGFRVEMANEQVETVRSDGSIAAYGERGLPLGASAWRQRIEPLREIAGGVLATLANPLPVIAGVPVVSDPRLQLGDTVRLVDPTGQGSLRATVVDINRSLALDTGKLTERLGVRPVAPPALGILDDPELGLLDSTLIMAT
jgi:hypothetical protein